MIFVGNEFDNIFEGSISVDILKGGFGNDIYYVGIDDIVEDDVGIDILMVVVVGKYMLEGWNDFEILKV